MNVERRGNKGLKGKIKKRHKRRMENIRDCFTVTKKNAYKIKLKHKIKLASKFQSFLKIITINKVH